MSKIKNTLFHPLLIDIFKDFTTYPILNFKTYFCNIDYIDNIKVSYVNNNIMVGIDSYNRPFICIKYKYNNQYIVETLFQRFTRDITQWAIGTCYDGVIKPGSGYFINKDAHYSDVLDKIKYIIDKQFIYDIHSKKFEPSQYLMKIILNELLEERKKYKVELKKILNENDFSSVYAQMVYDRQRWLKISANSLYSYMNANRFGYQVTISKKEVDDIEIELDKIKNDPMIKL